MARVRTRDTAPEVRLRRALHASGVRGWRLHPQLPGKPDLVFRGARLCVFVDGAFWRRASGQLHGQSGVFWDTKIARNRARDERVNSDLAALRSTSRYRFRDLEVEKDATACVTRVQAALTEAAGIRDRQ